MSLPATVWISAAVRLSGLVGGVEGSCKDPARHRTWWSNVNGDSGGVKATGLAATVEVVHSEAAIGLEINTLAGRDSVDSSGLAAGAIRLLVNGALVP
jgi:hypothetical protein